MSETYQENWEVSGDAVVELESGVNGALRVGGTFEGVFECTQDDLVDRVGVGLVSYNAKGIYLPRSVRADIVERLKTTYTSRFHKFLNLLCSQATPT